MCLCWMGGGGNEYIISQGMLLDVYALSWHLHDNVGSGWMRRFDITCCINNSYAPVAVVHLLIPSWDHQHPSCQSKVQLPNPQTVTGCPLLVKPMWLLFPKYFLSLSNGCAIHDSWLSMIRLCSQIQAPVMQAALFTGVFEKAHLNIPKHENRTPKEHPMFICTWEW